MRTIILFFLAFLVIFGCISETASPSITNETITKPSGTTDTSNITIIAKNLEIPWSIDFLPNGDIVFTERPGRIRLIENGALKNESLAIINAAATGESGLLGIAVDPGFDNNSYVYVYYTYRNGSSLANRVSRFVLQNYSATGEKIILDNIPGSGIHDGGRIKFGPDGFLYVTTGDAANSALAQDKTSLAGKILRINKTGSIPAENPFGTAVFSFGHRNPQGIDWHNSTTLYATEHGPIGNDELNLIEAGRNYQWPAFQCTNREDPSILCFRETIAPSGAAFHGNDLYISGLRGAQVRKITFGKNGSVVSQEVFLQGYGRIRDVVVKDDFLYVLTNNRDGRGLPGPDDDLILKIRLDVR